MESVNPVGAVTPADPIGRTAPGVAVAPSHPPAPSPEMVARFEALMARTDSAQRDAPGAGVPPQAVAAVEDKLAMYTDTLDSVMKVADGNMSLVDLQGLVVRNVTQVGIMSMTHTAYVQVLSAGKSSVSSLMKNQ